MYRDDVEEDYENTHLTDSFQNFFKEAIFNSNLDEYCALNWYWFQLIEKMVHVIGLHEELVVSDDFNLSDSEDELFNFWNESDYAKSFLTQLNDTKDLLLVSKSHLLLLEQQIIGFYLLHIGFIPNQEATYYNIPEIGDGENRVYSYRLNAFFSDVGTREGHIVSLTTDVDTLYVNGKKETNSINLFSDELLLLSSSSDIDSELQTITSSVNKALTVLKEIAPDLHETFTSFTKYIIPINEKGIVSYSMQMLPGYSCINMFERDFVDLIDDLLHENGHHFMNAILNLEELIHEDDEKIYYSPWRRALRPIRGIYHAYFTFYWAYELFYRLALFIEQNPDQQHFNESEVLKIQTRFIEEYYMLTFCESDMKKANKDGKLTIEGFEVFKIIHTRIESHHQSVEAIENRIQSAEIKELKEHLAQTKSHYL
ncbi:HEXXH motif domain protein [Bacteriovorax sp. Seq25_V]|nr:HEXXH motif domain protein [Bacteriovorax sp. Seq25_V]